MVIYEKLRDGVGEFQEDSGGAAEKIGISNFIS
jgi:hypothetical protein